MGQTLGASAANGDPGIQMIRELPAGEESYGGTPWSVQRLLITIHAQLGVFPSNSIVLTADQAAYFDATRAEAMDLIRRELPDHPEDPETLATLINLTVHKDIEKARRLVALSLQVSARDTASLHEARGMFFLEAGELGKAEAELLRAKELAPLDSRPRLGLIKLWQALGRKVEEEKELNELKAIGVRLADPFH
jgi:Flp pilus assembly protein TadD